MSKGDRTWQIAGLDWRELFKEIFEDIETLPPEEIDTALTAEHIDVEASFGAFRSVLGNVALSESILMASRPVALPSGVTPAREAASDRISCGPSADTSNIVHHGATIDASTQSFVAGPSRSGNHFRLASEDPTRDLPAIGRRDGNVTADPVAYRGQWAVVDGQGHAGTALVQRTMSALDGSLSAQECVDFLVINCGLAAVQLINGSVHVRLKPSRIAAGAFEGLIFFLHDRRWRRAAASTFVEGKWRFEVLPADRERAIDRVKAIVTQHLIGGGVLREERSLRSIPTGSPMHWALQVWQQQSFLKPTLKLQRSLAEETHGRYVWIDAVGGNRELIMTEVGGGFPNPVRDALRPGLGSRVQDQPDDVFGRYCAEAYGAAAACNAPMLEDIDAFVIPPSCQPVRRRYSRLILPFRSSGGHARLLGLSFENLAVDLRRCAS
jgi:hypothetical protein